MKQRWPMSGTFVFVINDRLRTVPLEFGEIRRMIGERFREGVELAIDRVKVESALMRFLS